MLNSLSFSSKLTVANRPHKNSTYHFGTSSEQGQRFEPAGLEKSPNLRGATVFLAVQSKDEASKAVCLIVLLRTRKSKKSDFFSLHKQDSDILKNLFLKIENSKCRHLPQGREGWTLT